MYLKYTSTFMEFIENIYLCQILLYPKTSISKVIEVYLPSNESTCNFLIHIDSHNALRAFNVDTSVSSIWHPLPLCQAFH